MANLIANAQVMWRPAPRPGRWAACCLLWLGLAVALPCGAAPAEGTAGQTVTGRSLNRYDGARRASRPHAPATVAAATPAEPTWKKLSAEQQRALQPLAPYWDRLGADRKLKWLLISKSYARLPADEQLRLHRRMARWVSLSQQQRDQARQNFKEITRLTPEERAAQWQAYQALSAEQRRQLAAQAQTQRAGVARAKTGAPHNKLAKGPRHRASARGAQLAEAALPIQQNTLLPRVGSETDGLVGPATEADDDIDETP